MYKCASWLIFTLLLSVAAPAAVATDIPGGPVSGTWTLAGSPYHVLGDIVVPVGETLAIEPGVEVVLSGTVEWTVQGLLLAEGSASDSIRISGAAPWDEIRLENETEASRFTHCHITDAETALHSIAAPMVVEQCQLGDHTVAIRVSAPNNPAPPAVEIAHTLIRDCQQHGIFVVENSNTTIHHCEITRCALDGSPRGAIQLSNQSAGIGNDPWIDNNWIHHNTWQGLTAFDVTGQGRIHPLVTHNRIEYNLTGVYLYYASGTLRFNEISHNFEAGNANSGAGVMIAGATSHPTLTDNNLTGNFTGFYIAEGATANLGDLNNGDPDDDGRNRIYGNVDMGGNTWSIYSNSTADIMAENNLWDSEDYGEIAVTIFDGNDNPAYGVVDFDPIIDSAGYPGEDAPTMTAPNLLSAAPNPFSGDTRLRLRVGDAQAGRPIDVRIYSSEGRCVRTLHGGVFQQGDLQISWDGTGDNGRKLPAGAYLGHLRLGGERYVEQLLLIR